MVICVTRKVRALLRDHQYGVLKGGYKIAQHTMRRARRQDLGLRELILLLDFANAFNEADRALMLKLVSVNLTELAKLAEWLYAKESGLVTEDGRQLTSSTGVQGCGLANILFGLLIFFIDGRLDPQGNLRLKKFYWDDGKLVGTPEAVSEVKLKKCHAHCGTPELAEELQVRNLVDESGFVDDMKLSLIDSNVHIHPDLNLDYLQVPHGDDDFVEEQLDQKLTALEESLSLVSRMPAKHGAFILLQKCASVCKVNHLMRTIPPQQISKFIQKFDFLVKETFERILGLYEPLTDYQWAVARLPLKYSGMLLRTGLSTRGAHYFNSFL